MLWNSHSHLVGKHATLSASKYSWIRYDEEKLERVFTAQQAARRGDELHDLASRAIRLREPLAPVKKTLNMYVNDAIGFLMRPEQTLFFTEDIFGTADAVSFRENVLRIFDLKTGVTPVGPDQLLIYAALFCLEYKKRPFHIEMDLRIYQNDHCVMYEVDPDDVFHIMEKAVAFDKRIKQMRREALV